MRLGWREREKNVSFSGSHPKSWFGGLEGTWESSLGRGLWGENTGEVGGRTVKSDPLILGVLEK